MTTNQDNPSGPVHDDARAAVSIAIDALTQERADLRVALLAGLIVVGTKVAGAITEATRVLDARLDTMLDRYNQAALERARLLARAHKDAAILVATGHDGDEGPSGKEN